MTFELLIDYFVHHNSVSAILGASWQGNYSTENANIGALDLV